MYAYVAWTIECGPGAGRGTTAVGDWAGCWANSTRHTRGAGSGPRGCRFRAINDICIAARHCNQSLQLVIAARCNFDGAEQNSCPKKAKEAPRLAFCAAERRAARRSPSARRSHAHIRRRPPPAYTRIASHALAGLRPMTSACRPASCGATANVPALSMLVLALRACASRPTPPTNLTRR